jgi:flagellar biosynthesis/type III secretory pathway protein FliH
MSKYEKFQYDDLPKSAVINSGFCQNESEVDKLILDAVSEHLTKIIDEEPVNQDEISGIHEQNESIDKILDNDNIRQEISEPVDLESIRKSAYDDGYKEAKDHYEQQIQSLNADNSFVNLVIEKLNAVVPGVELDKQLTKVSAEVLADIAKKLHLILPVNFDEIIRNGLFEKLKNFYKEGDITLTVHPDRYEFCTEVLQSEQIPFRFKDSLHIIKDENFSKDDCRIEWQDTRLEYNQEQVSAEIDKIINQLRSTTER